MMDFESLYAKYAPAVRRFALFLCGDPMMADDITSDTFLRALVKHEQIRQPTVKSYLLTIARNIYRDYGRKRARHPEAELHESIPDGRASAQVWLEQATEIRAALAALRELPDADRESFLMRVLEDMPYEEIAATLGISVVTARVKVHRARAKLMGVQGAAQEKSDAPGGKP